MQGIAQKVLADPGKYSIQQLQQAVQNGIIPAYIAIPIIQSKLQEQKQAQMAQSMQEPPAQQRPPVAQQVMSEARGLDALPTNLPAQYAAGGIVAFDSGGAVPRFQTGGVLDAAKARAQAAQQRLYTYGLLQRRQDPAGFQAAQQELTAAQEAVRAAENALTGGPAIITRTPQQGLVLQPSALPPTSTGATTRAATPAAAAAPATAPAASAAPRAAAPRAATPRAATPAATAAATAAEARQPSSGTGLRLNAGPGPGIGIDAPELPQRPFIEGATDIFQRQIYGTDTEPGFLARSRDRQAELDRKIQETEGKVAGKAYQGLEADLKKEAEEFGASKEQAKYMAVFKAGLAMMSGTSRHALENIGKGAMTGVEDYQAAAKDIKKAQKENQRMFAQIEQARRAEAIGDRDRAISRLDSAAGAEQRRDEFIVSGATNAGIKDAERKLEEWKTEYGGVRSLQGAHIAGRYDLAGREIAGGYDLLGREMAGRYGLAERELAGKYGLMAAGMRGAGRENITPAQMAKLRMDAEEKINPDALRAQVAQQLRLSKAPRPGADETFERKFQEAYNAAINERVNRAIGYGLTSPAGGANTTPYTGFKLVP